MRLLKVTRVGDHGEHVAMVVNLDQVEWMQEWAGGGTALYFAGGPFAVHVTESLATILERG